MKTVFRFSKFNDEPQPIEKVDGDSMNDVFLGTTQYVSVENSIHSHKKINFDRVCAKKNDATGYDGCNNISIEDDRTIVESNIHANKSEVDKDVKNCKNNKNMQMYLGYKNPTCGSNIKRYHMNQDCIDLINRSNIVNQHKINYSLKCSDYRKNAERENMYFMKEKASEKIFTQRYDVISHISGICSDEDKLTMSDADATNDYHSREKSMTKSCYEQGPYKENLRDSHSNGINAFDGNADNDADTNVEDSHQYYENYPSSHRDTKNNLKQAPNSDSFNKKMDVSISELENINKSTLLYVLIAAFHYCKQVLKKIKVRKKKSENLFQNVFDSIKRKKTQFYLNPENVNFKSLTKKSNVQIKDCDDTMGTCRCCKQGKAAEDDKSNGNDEELEPKMMFLQREIRKHLQNLEQKKVSSIERLSMLLRAQITNIKTAASANVLEDEKDISLLPFNGNISYLVLSSFSNGISKERGIFYQTMNKEVETSVIGILHDQAGDYIKYEGHQNETKKAKDCFAESLDKLFEKILEIRLKIEEIFRSVMFKIKSFEKPAKEALHILSKMKEARIPYLASKMYQQQLNAACISLKHAKCEDMKLRKKIQNIKRCLMRNENKVISTKRKLVQARNRLYSREFELHLARRDLENEKSRSLGDSHSFVQSLLQRRENVERQIRSISVISPVFVSDKTSKHLLFRFKECVISMEGLDQTNKLSSLFSVQVSPGSIILQKILEQRLRRSLENISSQGRRKRKICSSEDHHVDFFGQSKEANVSFQQHEESSEHSLLHFSATCDSSHRSHIVPVKPIASIISKTLNLITEFI